MARGGRVFRHACAAMLLAALVATPAAGASGTSRWRYVGSTETPRSWYQGIVGGARAAFFSGTRGEIFESNFGFGDRQERTKSMPASVSKASGYNHVGDLGWIHRGGAHLLLPLECYTPGATPDGNTCGTGAIAVVDAKTFGWQHVVTLDGRDIRKAMWVEASPDGQLVWTSSGRDLLGYSAAQVIDPPADGSPLEPVALVRGVAPSPHITGATFVGSRLFVAAHRGKHLQVWSIDLASGDRRLEISRPVDGESEGLATFDGRGGTLHWQVQPPKHRGARGRVLNYAPANP